MVAVTVNLRTQSNSATPHPATGTAPYPDAPLAVVPIHIWDKATDTWCRADGYCVAHRPSGFRLPTDWPDEAAAMAALRRARPDFPGWLMAQGGSNCAATAACRAMWRVARGA